MDLKLVLDTTALEGLGREWREFEGDLDRSAKLLAGQSHLKIIEMAQNRLHSRRAMYIEALKRPVEVAPGTWLIQLEPEAVWIEEGMCVVYGPAERHRPRVLTPDGWVSVTDVKTGMLVLNQDGKWTRVLEIFDNPLLDFCRENIDETETKKRFGYISDDLTRRSHKRLVLRCIRCSRTRVMSKYNWSRTGETFCPVCGPECDLVTIETKVSCTSRRFTVTGGHPVATARGWVEARHLTPDDRVLVPCWGKCPRCEGPVPYGGSKPCSTKCGSSLAQRRLLAAGKHQSQDPAWLSEVYRKRIATGKRVSGAEDVVAGVLAKTGEDVRFYGEPGEGGWVRQYPVPWSRDKLGRQRYAFLDFYNERLRLALEVDGAAYHVKERDDERDSMLRSRGIQVVRVPARCVRTGKFSNETLPAILSNHEGDIVYRDVAITDLKKRRWSSDLCLTRRWDIRVESGQSFVCQGILVHNSPHSMVDDLLARDFKVSKKGVRYRVIPFEHKKGPTSSTPAEEVLTNAVKTALKKLRIPYGKTEYEKDGVTAKSGLLYKFDDKTGQVQTPDRPKYAIETPNATNDPRFPKNQHGWGKGDIRKPMQGPANAGPNTGTPFLHGLRIYQTPLFNEDGSPTLDKKGRQKATRSIMTFRMVTSAHKGVKYDHPGIEGCGFFDLAFSWAEREWREKMLPDLLKKFGAR